MSIETKEKLMSVAKEVASRGLPAVIAFLGAHELVHGADPNLQVLCETFGALFGATVIEGIRLGIGNMDDQKRQ